MAMAIRAKIRPINVSPMMASALAFLSLWLKSLSHVAKNKPSILMAWTIAHSVTNQGLMANPCRLKIATVPRPIDSIAAGLMASKINSSHQWLKLFSLALMFMYDSLLFYARQQNKQPKKEACTSNYQHLAFPRCIRLSDGKQRKQHIKGSQRQQRVV